MDGCIVLTPLALRKYAITLQTDPETGIAVAVEEAGAPSLTSEQVAEALVGFS